MGCSRSKCTETIEIKTRDKESIVEEGKKEIKEEIKKEIKEEKEKIEENEDIIGDDILDYQSIIIVCRVSLIPLSKI